MPDPNSPPDSDSAPPAAARVDDANAEAMFGAVQGERELTPEELAAARSATRKMTSATGGGAGMWEPPTVEEAAQLFPGYEVLALLGRGGMGAVYQARQIELDRLVAIKLLPLEISADADFADRFRREARAMAKLNHPNIISVYDFGTTSEGHLFFVMEFVEGANLHAIIRAQELSADQALWLAGQVCAALAYAHGKGVVHRDIKPANVMVDTEGNAKVADFGLARLTDVNTEQLGHTQTGMVMGTPDYMAPEQMRGMNVDHRADIYSLGVMLYEMLCREVPRGIFSPPSARTGCDHRVDSIVVKAMQSEPDRRYQSTAEMKADMETARTPLPQAAPQRTSQRALAGGQRAVAAASAPPSKPASKLGLWVGIAVAVVLAGGAIAFFASSKPKPGARPAGPLAQESPPSPPQGQSVAGVASPSPSAATKDAPFVNSLGMKFVPVPGTKVLFGIWPTRVRDYAAYAAATPGVNAAWKNQGREFVPAGREPDHPVVGVNQYEARGFCEWLTAKEIAEGKLTPNQRYRLPTDEKWSIAVGLPPEQGATPQEKHQKNDVDFPWGRDWPPTKKVGNYADKRFNQKFAANRQAKEPGPAEPGLESYDDGFITTAPVGSFPPNPFGLYDMGGNVWQWCEDWFNASQKEAVQRGASWQTHDRSSLLSSARGKCAPDYHYYSNGFRCVLETGAAKTAVVAPPPAEGWIDLLASLDVKSGSFWEPWRLEGGVLKGPAAISKKDGHATIALAFSGPPANYDLRFRARRDRPGFAVKFFYIQGENGGFLDLDESGTGRVNFGWRDQENFERGNRRWFLPGEEHEILIQVRESGATAFLDGRSVQSPPAGKGHHVAVAANPAELKKPPFIGVNYCSGDFTVLAAAWRPATDAATSDAPPSIATKGACAEP